jgi:hypothetical protein
MPKIAWHDYYKWSIRRDKSTLMQRTNLFVFSLACYVPSSNWRDKSCCCHCFTTLKRESSRDVLVISKKMKTERWTCSDWQGIRLSLFIFYFVRRNQFVEFLSVEKWNRRSYFLVFSVLNSMAINIKVIFNKINRVLLCYVSSIYI